MRLQPFVVKPPLVLPASFSAMSGTANFLPEAQQAPSGRGETHARAVEAGAFDQQSASWLALCLEMATKICAVIGNFTIAELVANAPVLEAHTVASYVLEFDRHVFQVLELDWKLKPSPGMWFPNPSIGIAGGTARHALPARDHGLVRRLRLSPRSGEEADHLQRGASVIGRGQGMA